MLLKIEKAAGVIMEFV